MDAVNPASSRHCPAPRVLVLPQGRIRLVFPELQFLSNKIETFTFDDFGRAAKWNLSETTLVLEKKFKRHRQNFPVRLPQQNTFRSTPKYFRDIFCMPGNWDFLRR